MDTTTLGELVRIVGGELAHGDPDNRVGPDVVIDSRRVTPGAVFVALPGENVDGHSFVASAVAGGAGAALVTRRVDETSPQVVTSDAEQALAALARHVVADAQGRGLRTVALTGSSGKTSTKDLIAQVLESAAATVAPVGSFNNEIGVPLTACRIDSETQFLVSEMGARGQGHIRWLCSIVRPDIAVVLNVGTAHLGEFGTIADIATAKGEIVEPVPADGWAVLNADDPLVAAMAERTEGHIAWFSAAGRPGNPGGLSVWASDVTADDLARARFTLNAAHSSGTTHSAQVALRVLGRHAVSNALAAAAVALAAGLDIERVADALSQAEARSRWRMELSERPDAVAILNDSYNANPDSMQAGLNGLADLAQARRTTYPTAKRLAVLGEMRELGPNAPIEHERVGAMAAAAGVDLLVCLGPCAADLARGAMDAVPPVPTVKVLEDKSVVAAFLEPMLGPGDAILIKASRGAELDTVAEDLVRGGGGRCSQS